MSILFELIFWTVILFTALWLFAAICIVFAFVRHMFRKILG